MKRFPLAYSAALFASALAQMIQSVGARLAPMEHELSPLTQEWFAMGFVVVATVALYTAMPRIKD